MNDDEKHCRLINVQNPAPKPKSQKRKQGEPVESSKNESDEWDKYAEPAACRKQNVTRHFQHHSEGKFSLEDMKQKSKDGSQINQQLAISHSTSCVPILNTNKQMVQTIWLCCNYALKHGVNPIDNKTVNLDPRSIKKQIENLCQTYRRELIHMITDLLDEEDKHLKNMKESKETPKEDRMPKKMLLIGLQSDHARMQHRNFGAIDLSIKQLDIETMESKSYSLPFQIFQVADRKGKDSVANISHLRTFLTDNFEDHITKISLCGDGGLVTAKFCQTLQTDETLGHFAYYSARCANHAESLQCKWTIYRVLNDHGLHFRKLFPNRTISKGRKVVFFDESASKSFRRDFHYTV